MPKDIANDKTQIHELFTIQLEKLKIRRQDYKRQLAKFEKQETALKTLRV